MVISSSEEGFLGSNGQLVNATGKDWCLEKITVIIKDLTTSQIVDPSEKTGALYEEMFRTRADSELVTEEAEARSFPVPKTVLTERSAVTASNAGHQFISLSDQGWFVTGSHRLKDAAYKCGHSNHGNSFANFDPCSFEDYSSKMGKCREINVVRLGSSPSSTIFVMTTWTKLSMTTKGFRKAKDLHLHVPEPPRQVYQRSWSRGHGDTRELNYDKSNFELIMDKLRHYDKLPVFCHLISSASYEQNLEKLKKVEDRIKTICAIFAIFLQANTTAMVNDAYEEFLEHTIKMGTKRSDPTSETKVHQLKKYL
ncbi:hypothetical protein L596_009143 [Steinernema carpocapsae]|uniref:Uncharacterized protein n=1 Tax=Steinernema carpocapsae TaxID=34508 RepID=A0A4U5PEJ6_STECR|nr:hypothetical protein L596_009143 [Steinernema carpocapsae]